MTHLLVIAGTDSSGGAGLSRDIATAAAMGLGVMPVVTAVTVQTDHALHLVQPVPPGIIAAQIAAAVETSRPAAVKVGMLGSAEVAEAVAEALGPLGLAVVVDPVLRTTSGGALFAGGSAARLFAMAKVLTPNLDEARQLSGQDCDGSEVALAAQATLLRRLTGAEAVLVKGGHATGAECADMLAEAGGLTRLAATRLPYSLRGTGCTLSTGIAGYLAQGHDVRAACEAARGDLLAWMMTGRGRRVVAASHF